MVLIPVLYILARVGSEMEGKVGHLGVGGIAVDAEKFRLREVFTVGAYGNELQTEPLNEFVLNGLVNAESGIV